MYNHPLWLGPACDGRLTVPQCDGNDGKVSLRVAGFALFVGQRVAQSSVGVKLDDFWRVLVFYCGHVRVCFTLRLVRLRLAFLVLLFLSFFHRVCIIVTLNILTRTCSLRCIDNAYPSLSTNLESGTQFGVK